MNALTMGVALTVPPFVHYVRESKNTMPKYLITKITRDTFQCEKTFASLEEAQKYAMAEAMSMGPQQIVDRYWDYDVEEI